jgi:hypothetical protein
MTITTSELCKYNISEEEKKHIEERFNNLTKYIDRDLKTKYRMKLIKGKSVKLSYSSEDFDNIYYNEYLLNIFINKFKEKYTEAGWKLKIRKSFFPGANGDYLIFIFKMPRKIKVEEKQIKNRFEIIDLEK